MNTHCCSGAGFTDRLPDVKDEPPPRRLVQRAIQSAGCAVPGLLWLLLPKCPMCLAAWIAMVTGAGLSPFVAERLQALSFVLCLCPAAYLAAALIRRLSATPSSNDAD